VTGLFKSDSPVGIDPRAFSVGKTIRADGWFIITRHKKNRAGHKTQNFSLIVLISFPTAISASFSFIQANPIRVEFRETEPEL
jgi:hypothetical protein